MLIYNLIQFENQILKSFTILEYLDLQWACQSNKGYYKSMDTWFILCVCVCVCPALLLVLAEAFGHEGTLIQTV